jgi:hypothetical protein
MWACAPFNPEPHPSVREVGVVLGRALGRGFPQLRALTLPHTLNVASPAGILVRPMRMGGWVFLFLVITRFGSAMRRGWVVLQPDSSTSTQTQWPEPGNGEGMRMGPHGAHACMHI